VVHFHVSLPSLHSFPTRRSSDLLSLTRIFSNSFEIKEERIRNWRLLGIVMSLEVGGQVLARELRSAIRPLIPSGRSGDTLYPWRSEEHTSELQSRVDLVCRLLLE